MNKLPEKYPYLVNSEIIFTMIPGGLFVRCLSGDGRHFFLEEGPNYGVIYPLEGSPIFDFQYILFPEWNLETVVRYFQEWQPEGKIYMEIPPLENHPGDTPEEKKADKPTHYLFGYPIIED